MKPYLTYKPAGVPWLQQVPEHWEVVPNRALLSEVKESGRPEDEMLSVTIGRGVLKQAEHLATTTKKDSSRKDKSTYKRVGVGDIVYNKMRAWQGAFGVSKYSGIVSPAYVVQRPMDGTLPEFYHFLLRTPLFAKEAERNSYGLASDIWNLRPEHFKTILNVRPPIAEQHLIVRYLHALDAKVKRYIRAKRSLIARLQEQKQAIIQRAVTRGLDTNAPLKPSGVEWLGEVPVHWEVHRLKHVMSESEERAWDGQGLLLSLSRSRGLLPQSEISSRGQTAKHLRGYKVCHPQQVVMNRMQAWSGLFGLASAQGLVSPDYAVFNILPLTTPDYLFHLLRVPLVVDQFANASRGIGSGFNRLYTDKLGAIPVPLPPLPEQQSIVGFIRDSTTTIDRGINEVRREIELVHEYHTRLIADVVTGAVDVTAAAKGLTVEGKDEMMEEEPLNMAAEGEEEYGEQ